MKYLSPAKVAKAYMDKTVSAAIGTPTVDYPGAPNEQHYGFEAEIEGAGCQRRAERLNPDWWRLDRDGSLRGEAIETVFRRPLTRQETTEAFANFSERFQGFDDSAMSERTSVHVHYDVSNCKMRDLQKMVVGFYLLENLLVRRAGGVEREGNRFCLRNCDSETPLKALIDGFQAGDVSRYLRSERTARYSNLNLQALRKFGSLEVRCHKGSVDADEFEAWLAVVDEIFTVSRTFPEAREIIEKQSELGVLGFLTEYFPLTEVYTRSIVTREELIYNGLDYAQMLAYCVDIVAKGPLKPRKKGPATPRSRTGGFRTNTNPAQPAVDNYTQRLRRLRAIYPRAEDESRLGYTARIDRLYNEYFG